MGSHRRHCKRMFSKNFSVIFKYNFSTEIPYSKSSKTTVFAVFGAHRSTEVTRKMSKTLQLLNVAAILVKPESLPTKISVQLITPIVSARFSAFKISAPYGQHSAKRQYSAGEPTKRTVKPSFIKSSASARNLSSPHSFSFHPAQGANRTSSDCGRLYF